MNNKSTKQIKMILLIVLFGAFAKIATAQIVNIPDANFKAALVADLAINTNADGEIQLSEASAFTGSIDVSYQNITDLTGIETFTNLTELYCHNNQLTSLNVLSNTALTVLDCGNNMFVGLSLSTNIQLQTLFCAHNQITSLNLSNNTQLLAVFCDDNLLTTLDVSNLPSLEGLWCFQNSLSSLIVSNNPQLTDLRCNLNQITDLDVSLNTMLNYLDCSDNQLSSLDVSSNTALKYLYCDINPLSSLNVSTNTALEDLYCSSNQLSTLDVSTNTALLRLDCSANQLSSLDVSTNLALQTLNCSHNQLSSLDVSLNTSLVELRCGNNSLSSLDVSLNTLLETLFCGFNSLSSLDVSTNFALQILNCSVNQLSSLDVSTNMALWQLYCSANQLSSLDVSAITALGYLNCDNNQIITLDLSANINLNELDCSDNLLTNLNIQNGNNINLTFLEANNNPSLFCIEVDDPTFMDNNFLGYIDSWASFNLNCSCTNPTAPTGISGLTSICNGANTTLSANGGLDGSGAIYEWGTGAIGSNIIVGQNASTITVSPSINTTYWVRRVGTVPPCTNNTAGVTQLVTVTPTAVPSLNISANPGNTICNGTSVTFTATPVNGGAAPAYQWKLNGANVGSNSATYTNASLSNGNTIQCVLTSNANCASPLTANSNTVTMVVSSTLTPSVSISANPGNNICNGTSVTFTAVPTNGGTTPAYQWKLNGTNVGTNSSTYINAGLVNGDAITCVLTSNDPCASPLTANSNTVTMVVSSTLTPSVSISANPGNNICVGTSVTFTAVPTNGGATPAYQWKLNGANVGANSTTYTNAGLVNGDAITCVLTSNDPCASPLSANSNTLNMIVNGLVTPSVNISANPGATICNGTSVTFTATPVNGGAAPAYQWKLNGANVGSNSATYTNASLNNADAIQCVLTSNANCASPLTANSNTLNMTVNAIVTPSVNIVANPGNTICNGTSVTFTATPVNGGAAPSYQWKLNGINVGSNSTTYTNTSLNNADDIQCILTSNANCASPLTANSNTINMTVNSSVTPSVNISANPGNTICNGTSVTFTATPVNAGAAPTYQWQVNGVNVGTNSNTYTSTTLSNNNVVSCILTSNANCASPTQVGSNNINMLVNPNLTPSVTISATSTTVCSGSTIDFTANTTNGGLTPAYQWQVNGINVGTNASTYSTASLLNNDVITCILTSNETCLTTANATSNSITMTNGNVTPTVTINASQTNVCEGTSITFSASTTDGGTLPVYQWQVNGIDVGSNLPTYTSTNLADNDVVQCILTSNALCITTNTVNSNNIQITIIAAVIPTVSITANPGVSICSAVPVTFTANPVNGGTPNYQWKLNGFNVGTNSNSYTTNTLNDNDIVTCEMTSNANCANPVLVTSNSLTISVTGNVIPSIIISSANGNTICEGTSVTLNANVQNEGVAPQFEWMINGNISGNNSNTFTTNTLLNGDVVQCILTSSLACASPITASSNNIGFIVNPNLNSSLTINASQNTICAGTAVYFTTSVQNGGSQPAFQWQLNGINVGSNSPFYSASNFNNNDVVSCWLISNEACVVQNPSNSNDINITVNNNVFSPNFLADQTVLTQIPFTVNFTNTTPNQGSYVYQWYFGDGSTSTDASPLHQFNSSGTYTVALQAKDNQTGCVDEIIKNDYIICSNGSSNCNYSNTLNYTGIVNGCIGGYLDLSVSTTATNPTYQWVRDGVYIGGATQSTFHANVSGSYSVIVYNNGGCAVPSSYTQVSFSGTAPVLPTINQTGNLNPCVPSVVTLEANAPGANSFLWNTGSTNSTINVSQSGYYTVTAFFGVGCQASSLPLPLSGSLAPNPGICLVTVDSATNNNLIVWETPNSTNIDSIFIYKETSNLNIFQKIGSVGYNDLSEFIDGSSNTQIQGYRYQIVVLDTCGGITLPSYAHKTIHLQINPGVNNNRELSWSAYEGTNFVAYEIWRKIPGDIFQLLTTVPASQNIYTDNNPISLDADYKIEIVLAQTCNSIDRAAYGKSKSNVGNNQAILLVPDGIEDKNLLANVKILPNPSNGNTMLQWESSKAQNLQIVVTDVIGKVVIANNVNAQKGNNSYNITVDAAGVYFVTIFNANGSKNVLKMVVR